MNHKADDQAVNWQRAYSERDAEEMSWTEARPEASLALIEMAGLGPDAAILDLGGGASRLAGELLRAGYRDVSVADISPAALERAKAELGPAAERIAWIVADVRTDDFGRRFDLWHDRAVFHFMVGPTHREAYLATLERSLEPDGHVVLATFGPEGPTECSGLPVARYDVDQIQDALGQGFDLVASRVIDHRTPRGHRRSSSMCSSAAARRAAVVSHRKASAFSAGARSGGASPPAVRGRGGRTARSRRGGRRA